MQKYELLTLLFQHICISVTKYQYATITQSDNKNQYFNQVRTIIIDLMVAIWIDRIENDYNSIDDERLQMIVVCTFIQN